MRFIVNTHMIYTENTSPYTITGHQEKRVMLRGVRLAEGIYVIRAIPYSEQNRRSVVGVYLNLYLSIVDTP